MTTLSFANGAIWPATPDIAAYGTARTMTSASRAAASVVAAAVAPMASATSRVFASSCAANVTSCPARANEPPSALPTLPVPMTAIFMACLPFLGPRRSASPLDLLLLANQDCRYTQGSAPAVRSQQGLVRENSQVVQTAPAAAL